MNVKKTLKHFVPTLTLSIIITLFSMTIQSMAAEPEVSFAGGDGSAGNPYQIANAEQFTLMTEKVNSEGSYAGKHYKLISDIVMPTVGAGESNHNPIGTLAYYPFSGSFDGQNYSISGIKIDRPTERSQGLFYNIKGGGVVKNLRMINASISAVAWAGGIVANNSGTVENCSYAGEMKGGINSGDYAGSCIGGIAGINNGTISGCVNTASITTGIGPWNQSNGVGGIAGDNYGMIRNCYNSGTITTPLASSMTGGIVGDNRTGRVFNSYNIGKLDAAGTVGGVTGYNYGNVQNNYSSGSLTSKGGPGGMSVSLGGISGKNYINSSTYGTLVNNYWLKSTAANGLGTVDGTYNSCASFIDVGGALTAVSGHTVIENKETLVDALNAWVTVNNNSTGTTTYSFWKTSGGYPVFTPAYLISVDCKDGTMTVNRTAAEGHTVSMTPAPAYGYRLVPGSTVKVIGSSGMELAVNAEGGSYTFTMPAGPVTITASFEIIPADKPVISWEPSAVTGYYGTSTPLQITASVTDDGELSYQWYKGTSGVDLTPEDSKKAGTGNPLNLPEDLPLGTHYYFCVVTNTIFNGEFCRTLGSNIEVTIEKGIPNLGTVSAGPIYVGESLTLSELTKTAAISGELSWETNAEFSSASAGTVAVTYSFTPTGEYADLYHPLTDQIVNLTINTRKILSVEAISPVADKSFLSPQASLGLPASVTVSVQGTVSDETRVLSVAWEGYNANTIDPQTLSGILDLAGNTELNNDDSVSASILVTLRELPFVEIADVTAMIKVGATDGAAKLRELIESQFDGTVSGADWTVLPVNYDLAADTQTVVIRVNAKYGYTSHFRDVEVSFTIVNPKTLSYVTEVPVIKATDEQNRSGEDLLAYVNTYNALNAEWDEEAIGTTSAADSAPPYASLPISYVPTGAAYEFSKTYLGHNLSQTVTVNEVKQPAPVLEISYNAETISTTASMAYKMPGGDFANCTADMSIESMLGSTVAFKTNASGYKIDSDIVEITFSAREAAPSGLFATINDEKNKILIEGLEELVAYEYSLDNSAFSDLTVSDDCATISVSDYQSQIYIRKKHVPDMKVCSETAVVDVNYTLTFDSKGGTAVSPLFGVSGANIPAPFAPIRSGYMFIGWHDSSDSRITFPYTITGNTALYAGWLEVPEEPKPQDGADIEVGGEIKTEILDDGKRSSTFTVDDEKLETLLMKSGNNPTASLLLTGSDIAVMQMSGRSIKNLEAKDAVLEIETENVTYILPALQIDIDSVAVQLGTDVLDDIGVRITIGIPPDDTVKFIEDLANKNNYQIVVQPIEFTITCSSGANTVEVSKFASYVDRLVAIPEGADPSKITTGVVLNADGTLSHVPTTIIMIDGKYYAKISSLTNSTYCVILNHVEFTDVEDHWAKDAVNDMGSRMVVTGIGGGIYEPERSITRAEFAAIIVRAMGLKKDATESAFGDVTLTDWFNGYVGTATAYGLVTGYDSSSYRPNETITREQAMTILERAMKKIGLEVQLTDGEIASLLAAYADGSDVSDYARTGVAACLKTGVINGSSATTLSPKDYVTRAEVAVMIQRLLLNSGLI